MNNQPAPSSFLASRDMPRPKASARHTHEDIDATQAKMTSLFTMPSFVSPPSAPSPASSAAR